MKKYMENQIYLIKVSEKDPSSWIKENAGTFRELFGYDGMFCHLDQTDIKENLSEIEKILYGYQKISKEGDKN